MALFIEPVVGYVTRFPLRFVIQIQRSTSFPYRHPERSAGLWEWAKDLVHRVQLVELGPNPQILRLRTRPAHVPALDDGYIGEGETDSKIFITTK